MTDSSPPADKPFHLAHHVRAWPSPRPGAVRISLEAASSGSYVDIPVNEMAKFVGVLKAMTSAAAGLPSTMVKGAGDEVFIPPPIANPKYEFGSTDYEQPILALQIQDNIWLSFCFNQDAARHIGSTLLGLAEESEDTRVPDDTLAKMANNPRGDWRLTDVYRVSRRLGIICSPPTGGGSHFKLSHHLLPDILTIPKRSPIKPIYIKAFVDFARRLEAEDGE